MLTKDTSAPAIRDLGGLAPPGDTLKNTTQNIVAGDALRFETDENQIYGISAMSAPGLAVDRTLIRQNTSGDLGGTTRRQDTLTVPASASRGRTDDVSTSGNDQVRNEAGRTFTLHLHVP